MSQWSYGSTGENIFRLRRCTCLQLIFFKFAQNILVHLYYTCVLPLSKLLSKVEKNGRYDSLTDYATNFIISGTVYFHNLRKFSVAEYPQTSVLQVLGINRITSSYPKRYEQFIPSKRPHTRCGNKSLKTCLLQYIPFRL